jgi:hypothetical protein
VALGLVAVSLGVSFLFLGLEKADQLASTAGAFIGLAGLGVSVYGLVRRPESRAVRGTEPAMSSPPVEPSPQAEPSSQAGSRHVTAERRYGGDHIEFRDSTFHGPVTGKSVRHTDTG